MLAPAKTATPQPIVMSTQDAVSPSELVRGRSTVAPAPPPNRIRTAVPMNSHRMISPPLRVAVMPVRLPWMYALGRARSAPTSTPTLSGVVHTCPWTVRPGADGRDAYPTPTDARTATSARGYRRARVPQVARALVDAHRSGRPRRHTS